jgi:HD-GYP domain-containing protein (c-di-GMP phosphodiesterase class II)
MPTAREVSPSLLRSRAFALESLRSERLRTIWTILALVGLVVLYLVRVLAERRPEDRGALPIVLGLVGAAITYEFILAALINRHLRARTPPRGIVWALNTIVESLFPSVALFTMTVAGNFGPFRVLLSPAASLYWFAIILSTLRLRPDLCILSGAVSALGYGAVAAYTFAQFPDHPNAAIFEGSIYASAAAGLFVGSLVAAAVAGQVRRHASEAIREAVETQRAHVHARNTLIFGLAKLAEYRDSDTGAHLERISAYAALLAGAMRTAHPEIDHTWIETLRVASSMHDIGKVGIPDSVLLKPGPLDEDERRVIENHPAIGAETLGAIEQRHGADSLLAMSREIALSHHERWDGSGYPNSTPGARIPLAARIVAVADAYDALTVARIYKPALGHDEARRIIHEGRGTQFDPVVVEAFMRIERSFDAVRMRHTRAP